MSTKMSAGKSQHTADNDSYGQISGCWQDISFVVCTTEFAPFNSDVVLNMECLVGDFFFTPTPCLKKHQNAPRSSEHPPVKGENMSKRLGGIKGCKYKTSSWHFNGFPDGNNIGSTL